MVKDAARSTSEGRVPVASLDIEVAAFIERTKFDDIPETVLERAKCSILDGLGVALAGSKSKPGTLLYSYLEDLGVLGDHGATLVGKSMRSSPRFAAFANGVAIHGDDFDDTQLAASPDRVYGLLTHPTAPVLPVVLAIAETQNASGKAFLVGYNVGVEVECKVAEAINPRHYIDGFHSTGTCGALGAAAAALSVRGRAGEAEIRRSLSIAASQSAGLRENFGTMTKPFHAGRAAEAGIIATDLASRGWTASEDILTAPRGFFSAAGGGYDSSSISGKLGAPWVFDFPGVSIKPHPSGSLTHPAMTEMSELIARYGIKANDVEEVIVGTNRNMPNALIYHDPETELEAKFSMEFCMAILILEGRAGLAEFTDEIVNRGDVKQMMKRVRFEVDPEAEAAGYDKMTSIITIRLLSGEVILGRADFGKGSPLYPMSYSDVAEKFFECASFAAWPLIDAERVVELVDSLAALESLAPLTAALRQTDPHERH
jgi:2-methylcitrate dehydratase PrpD